jgi:ketosteroid isomerase-like protein
VGGDVGAERAAEALAELLDRAAITAVLHQYADGMGSQDASQVIDCFTDDAFIDYGFATVQGRAEMEEFFGFGGSGKGPIGLDHTTSRMQILPSISITLRGDEAEVRSKGLSAYGGWRDGEAIVVMRSLAYEDEVVRVGETWRIRRRIHHPGWQVELPAQSVPPVL